MTLLVNASLFSAFVSVYILTGSVAQLSELWLH